MHVNHLEYKRLPLGAMVNKVQLYRVRLLQQINLSLFFMKETVKFRTLHYKMMLSHTLVFLCYMTYNLIT